MNQFLVAVLYIVAGAVLGQLINKYRGTIKLREKAVKDALCAEFKYAHTRIDDVRNDVRAELSGVHQDLHQRLVEVENFFNRMRGRDPHIATAGPATGGTASAQGKTTGKKS